MVVDASDPTGMHNNGESCALSSYSHQRRRAALFLVASVNALAVCRMVSSGDAG